MLFIFLGKVITAETYIIIISNYYYHDWVGVLSHYLKAKYCFSVLVLVFCVCVIGGAHNGMYINTSIFYRNGFCFLYYLVLVLIFTAQKERLPNRLLSSNGVSGGGGGGVVAVGNVG